MQKSPESMNPTLSGRLATLLATGFGAGFSPIASGTAGTLVAIAPAFFFVRELSGQPLAQVVVLIAVAAVAIWSAGAAAPGFGLKDPGQIVVDEIGWLMMGSAFLLFRLFDIVKPPPCRWAETLPGGLGIVADDLLAGLYANLVLQFLCVSGALSL
jgi:phosphatidylglycerophosphatase A